MNALLDPDRSLFDKVMAAFPSAVGFFEVPDSELAAVNLGESGVWLFDPSDEVFPRPISDEELKARGAFSCKPEDFAELLPDNAWP